MLRVSEDGQRRPEAYLENYHQLARTLIDLQSAADQVFDAISQRTAQERDKLAAISRRIQSAKAKIDVISQSGKDITITSPLRYPAGGVNQEDFKPILTSQNDGDIGLPLPKLLVNGGLSREFGPDGTLELFQFFSVENDGYPVKDDQVTLKEKAADLSQPREGRLFKSQNSADESLAATINTLSDSKLKSSKKNVLPPAPPSLIPKDFQPLSFSENNKFKSTSEPA